MHVLIDTNIWRYLVERPEFAKDLDDLEMLVEKKHITLLIPERLKKECDKHLTKAIEQVKKNVTASFSNVDSEILENELNSQVSSATAKKLRVEALLAKGRSFKPPGMVNTQVLKRRDDGLAPFHGGKINNIDDAMIFFTTIHWLKKKQIAEFILITNNGDDFGNPQEKNKIHPQLESFVPVTYFIALYPAIAHLKHQLGIEEIAPKPQDFVIHVVEPREDMLDYLYALVKKIYHESGFIPTEVLARLAPFRIAGNEGGFSDYNGWTLHSNNPKLLAFFKKIDVETFRFSADSGYENSKKNLDRLHNILRVLNQNLVFNVAYNFDTVSFRFDLPKPKKKRSIFTGYGSMDWPKAMQVPIPVEITEKNWKEVLSDAAACHDMGFESESMSLYLRLYQFAKNTKRKLLQFNLLHSVKWRINFYDDSLPEEFAGLIKEVKEKEVQQTFFMFNSCTKFDQEMAASHFQLFYIQRLSEDVKDSNRNIHEHYYSQLRGGYSSNNHLSKLYNSFLEYMLFIGENGIPFTGFSQFSDVLEQYVEALLMNSELNEYQSEKIDGLDNNMVTVFIYYTSPQLLTKYYNRHLKKPIRFISAGHQEPSALPCIRNFLKNYPKAWKIITAKHGDFGSRQAALQNRLWNMVVVLSIVDFSDAFLVEMAEYLLIILRTSLPVNAPEAKYLGMLIRQRANLLGTTYLKKLLKICLANPVLHIPDIYEAFANDNDNGKPLLVNSTATFDVIRNIFEDKRATGNVWANGLFYTLYLVSTPSVKKLYATYIEKQLGHKFHLGMFFKASFMQIIDAKPLWSAYLDSFETPAEKPNKTPISFGETKLREINDLMNLVFKLDLKLPNSFVERFKGFSEYYDWLLDMEHFNYALFNPLWILQYQSWFYYQRIFSLEQVRSSVREYLRHHDQPQLAKAYTFHVGE